MSDVSTFLEHYGVKGMKWGSRKRSTHPVSEDFKESRELKRKGAPALSTHELKKVNERLNLETNFNRLNPNVVQRGHKQVAAILAVGATVNAAIAFAGSPAGQAMVKKLFSKGAK